MDNPTPQLDTYDKARKKYRDYIASGGKVSIYTCVNPQRDYMSRIGDFPLISTRAIGWYCAKEGISGYLHYAWNDWSLAATAYQPANDMYVLDAPCDSWIVYPDIKNLSVFESLRSVATRDSWEDLELIYIAKSKNEKATNELVEKAVQKGNKFIRDSAELFELREQLLKIAVSE